MQKGTTVAKLTLTIEADNAAELMGEVNALAKPQKATMPAPGAAVNELEESGEEPQTTAVHDAEPAAKRTRRTKEQIAADEAAKTAPAADPFAEQVREAVAEDDAAPVTVEQVKAIGSKFNADQGAPALRAKLSAFQDVEGQAVGSFSKLQPKDYAAFTASLG